MQTLEKRYLLAKRRLFDIAYSELNDMQRAAVFNVNGPLLVLAGAGSGKTTVLVKRIAYIIKYGNAYFNNEVPHGLTEDRVARLEAAAQLTKAEIEEILPEFISSPCPPWRMLAITFTNKAANEIKARLASAFNDESISSEIWAGTFHSVCMRILRTHYELCGLKTGFTIYDADDTKKAVQAVMKELNIDDKMLPLKSVISRISKAKENLQSPEAFEAEYGGDFRMAYISRIYKKYEERMRASNALDFDDIILRTVELLRDNKDIREKYAGRFLYTSIDEFQDTNSAQFLLTNLLSITHRNLMVVGDDDQSIYRFRGATVENILGFDKEYTDAKVIKLEQNYRSTQNILDAANHVIAHNDSRHGKTLWTDNNMGEKIRVRKLENQDREARFIADTVAEMVAKQGKKYSDFAVLYRTNAQANSIETVLAKSGVPYRVLGGTRFADRKEIRDIVAYLQLINNHSDRERLLRIINEPRRGIGDKTLSGIAQIALEQGTSMFSVIENADKYAALSRSASSLLEFAAVINRLTALSEAVSLDELVKQTLDYSGYRQMLIEGGAAEKDRLDNLDEFVSGVIEYQNRAEAPTLTGFLEENALVADVDRYDETADAIVLMTIHSSKGLEFPVVFIPGMEDGIFPGMQSALDMRELEEERRLAYVAITRAKQELFLLHTSSRMMYGRTQYNPVSRFVTEIPEKLKDEKQLQSAPAYGEYRRPQQSATSSPRVYYTESATAQKQSNVGGGGISVNSKPKSAPATAAGTFAVGDIVTHMSFGKGEIISVKQLGADTLYEIIFDKVGTKKLMATYARLKKG